MRSGGGAAIIMSEHTAVRAGSTASWRAKGGGHPLTKRIRDTAPGKFASLTPTLAALFNRYPLKLCCPRAISIAALEMNAPPRVDGGHRELPDQLVALPIDLVDLPGHNAVAGLVSKRVKRLSVTPAQFVSDLSGHHSYGIATNFKAQALGELNLLGRSRARAMAFTNRLRHCVVDPSRCNASAVAGDAD